MNMGEQKSSFVDYDYDTLIKQLVSNYQTMVDVISTKLDVIEQKHHQSHEC